MPPILARNLDFSETTAMISGAVLQKEFIIEPLVVMVAIQRLVATVPIQ